MSIFHRPLGHLHLRHPKERGQSHLSIRLHQMWGDFEESGHSEVWGIQGGADGYMFIFSLWVCFSCDEQEGLFINLGCTGREAICCRGKLSAGRHRTRS